MADFTAIKDVIVRMATIFEKYAKILIKYYILLEYNQ
jgi:hypothetical protein